MKVLHIVHSFTPEAGGNAKVVAELTENLVREGVLTTIFTTITKKGKKENLFRPKGMDLFIFQESFLARWWPYHAFGIRKSLLKEMFEFDIVHIHDIWHFPNYAGYYAAKKIGKPYIITPHGTLEPWALKYKGLKKRIYMALIQKRIMQEAAAIHAISHEEVKHIRALGINNTILMISNGIAPEEFQDLPSREELEQLYPGLSGNQVILFLSRIHPKKGLDILAKALGEVARDRGDICLLIAGPDNNGYRAQVERMLEAEGVLDKVIFTGMLTGRKKLAALGGADIFVLPSYSEGRSIAALEAVTCGLPVIISHPCNFPEVAEVKAGIVIDPDPEQLTKALLKLLNDPKLREEMGENGRRMVLERFTWNKITKQMINLYEKILLNHTKKKSIL